MQWFEKWFDELYLKLYSHRDDSDAKKQINLIINTIAPSKSDRILDLGCGEGRHCKIFKENGYLIEGIDLSKTLISSGKKKWPHLNIKVGDMRKIEGTFDIILSLFTSFGYFETDEENQAVVDSISNSLTKNGIFWLDFLNPDYLKENLIPSSSKTLDNGIVVKEKRKIENGFVIKNIIFDSGEQYTEKVKLLEKKTLERMFLKASITPVAVFGDYNGSKWDKTSKRTIIYGKKQ